MRALAQTHTSHHPGRTGRAIGRGGLLLLASLAAAVLPARAFTAAQVQAGARTYKRQCARCHGVNGEGKDNAYKGLRSPELIGASALPCHPRPFQKLRTHVFRRAQDVYAFASALMPADQPAILDADEYWDVIAYLLHANGMAANDTRLDATSAAQVVLHPDCASTGDPVADEARP
jgi:mono/diheme cytochrome c family protein